MTETEAWMQVCSSQLPEAIRRLSMNVSIDTAPWNVRWPPAMQRQRADAEEAF